MNQDEALSAWNAWCMLREGRALSGEPWPVFHCRNIGDYPTMSFFYVLLPFQAIGGLSVFTTRLPAALSGVFAVLCTWHVARALYGERAAAFASAALAIAPWSIFLGHFGTGASLGPLQAVLPLSMLLAARLLPGRSGEDAPPVAGWALAAGLTFGIGTYGFHSLRLQLPLTLFLLVALFPSHWRRVISSPGGLRATLLLAAGFLVTFGPMAWVSFTDPDSLRRWQMTRSGPTARRSRRSHAWYSSAGRCISCPTSSSCAETT
ncbi:MAG: glycosyltransferase family 39 protein [Candidatus Eisenbacteria bacterium]|nr:glycosyltransferase family 39 protein [Candidatus Eisenbacteria bacterium]